MRQRGSDAVAGFERQSAHPNQELPDFGCINPPSISLTELNTGLEIPLTEDLLKSAKDKYGQAEVYRVRSESHPISFENNRLKEVMRRDCICRPIDACIFQPTAN